MNDSNLKPLNTRTPEERKEIATKGQKASVISRRKKKMMKELLELALSQETETGDHYTDVTAALIRKAEEGSEKAYELIVKVLGQMPKDEVEVTGNSIKINISGDDD